MTDGITIASGPLINTDAFRLIEQIQKSLKDAFLLPHDYMKEIRSTAAEIEQTSQMVKNSIGKYLENLPRQDWSIGCWVPTNSGIKRVGQYVQAYGWEGTEIGRKEKTLKKRYSSRRLARRAAKRMLQTMFVDYTITPAEPVEFISINLEIAKDVTNVDA